jgi:hypothetical protein
MYVSAGDTCTSSDGSNDATTLPQLWAEIGLDFFNGMLLHSDKTYLPPPLLFDNLFMRVFAGDTMTFINQSFFNNSVSFGNPLAIQPEGGPVPNSLEWSKMGWHVTLRPALNAYINDLI